MQVTISTPTRFHAFDLARELFRHRGLHRLFTGPYPKTRLKDLPLDRTRRFWPMAAALAAGKFLSLPSSSPVRFFWRDAFDRWITRQRWEGDVFHGFSGYCLHSLQEARRRGVFSVCDRASTHSLFQQKIMKEERSLHGLPPGEPIPGRILERHIQEYEAADVIQVPSRFVYRSFLQNGFPGEKIFVNPFGIDLQRFHPLPKEDRVFRVVYAGTMSLRKGIPYLLRALAPLRLPNFEVVLIGSMTGELKPLFHKYEGKYRYIGEVPQERLPWHLSQGSVFLLASIEEGLAYVLAQAMACGLPIIATNHSGAEELITKGQEGFVVPVRDPESLRDRVLELYEDPGRREAMASAALRRARSLGGWKSYGERAWKLYDSMISGPGKPPRGAR